MDKHKVDRLSEANLVKLLGEESVAELEETYDVDLSEGAVAVTLANGSVATVAVIEEVLKLSAAKESVPMLIIASKFEADAANKALEFEDVVLCTKSGAGKLSPLIPA